MDLMGKPGRIRVLGGVMRPPLLDTHEATILEFRDKFDDLVALFTRHFNDDMWIFVTKQDDDWESTLIRLGYMRSPVGIHQLLTELKAGGH